MLNKTLDKQAKLWQKFVKLDTRFRKSLRHDKVLCRILLSNKQIYTTFSSVKEPINVDYNNLVARTKVAGRPFKIYKSGFIGTSKRTYTAPCTGGNYPGTFNHQVRQMTHLSEFLACLPAFVARRPL